MEENIICNGEQKVFFKTIKKNSNDLHFILGNNCRLGVFLIVSGSVEFRLETISRGLNSEIDIRIVALAKNQDIQKIHTVQNHIVSSTSSRLHIKSLNSGISDFTFEGIIRVGKSASLTDAYQRCDSLMLSDKAVCLTRPVLEIDTNDVRCTHGATVFPIRKDELEYLNSRGINSFDAETLIAGGFVKSAFSKADSSSKIVLDKFLEKYFGYSYEII